MITPWQKTFRALNPHAVDTLACLEPAQGPLYSAAVKAVNMPQVL